MSQKADEVVLCSGKAFYDIDAAIQKDRSGKNILVIRVEELAPFPALQIKSTLEHYASSGSKVTWV